MVCERITYRLTEGKCRAEECENIIVWGIEICEERDGKTERRLVSDLSSDRESVEDLLAKLTDNDISMESFFEILEDFVS